MRHKGTNTHNKVVSVATVTVKTLNLRFVKFPSVKFSEILGVWRRYQVEYYIKKLGKVVGAVFKIFCEICFTKKLFRGISCSKKTASSCNIQNLKKLTKEKISTVIFLNFVTKIVFPPINLRIDSKNVHTEKKKP